MRTKVASTFVLVALSSSSLSAQVALEETTRSGGLDGVSQLSRMADLSVSRSGRVAIAEAQFGSVKVFDSAGAFLGEIGRQGEGPGEFSAPVEVGWHGDRLWVYDRNQIRVSHFRLDGAFISSFRAVYAPQEYPFVASGPEAVRLDSGLIVKPQFPDDAAEEISGPIPILHVEPSGDVVRTIAQLPLGDPYLSVNFGPGGVGQRIVIPQPFTTDPLWATSDDGSIVVIADVRGRAGALGARVTAIATEPYDTLWVRDVGPAPVKFDEGLSEDFINNFFEGFPIELPPSTLREMRTDFSNDLYRPEYLPVFTDAFIDAEERIWLREYVSSDEVARWTIVSRAGDTLGRVDVPASVDLLDASAEAVWGGGVDDFGVPTIHRFSLRGVL